MWSVIDTSRAQAAPPAPGLSVFFMSQNRMVCVLGPVPPLLLRPIGRRPGVSPSFIHISYIYICTHTYVCVEHVHKGGGTLSLSHTLSLLSLSLSLTHTHTLSLSLSFSLSLSLSHPFRLLSALLLELCFDSSGMVRGPTPAVPRAAPPASV